MKSVLMSIQPKWCELIASGKKTVEVRKTKPKLETPFKVYIYCTKPRKFIRAGCGTYEDTLFLNPDTNEIKCDQPWELMCCEKDYSQDNFLNGKVIGEFVCDNIEIIEYNPSFYFMRHGACLKVCELWDYGKGKTLYAWHISNLVIYDKPRELSEFWKCNYPFDCGVCDYFDGFTMSCEKPKRPPQSWCYVESEVITNEQI